MTPAGNSDPHPFDSAPVDPTHGSSGGGGPLPEPEIPQAHPTWCSPAHCTVADDRNRWHASRPVTVRGTGDTSDLSITVQIFAWPDGGNAYVDIAPTLIDMEGGTTTEEWPVPAELALELGHVLVSLARQATP